MKEGKFGLYITHGSKNKSIKFLNKKYDEIVLDDIINIINKNNKSNPNILKQLNLTVLSLTKKQKAFTLIIKE